jgi:hypothetical protein
LNLPLPATFPESGLRGRAEECARVPTGPRAARCCAGAAAGVEAESVLRFRWNNDGRHDTSPRRSRPGRNHQTSRQLNRLAGKGSALKARFQFLLPVSVKCRVGRTDRARTQARPPASSALARRRGDDYRRRRARRRGTGPALDVPGPVPQARGRRRVPDADAPAPPRRAAPRGQARTRRRGAAVSAAGLPARPRPCGPGR